MESALTGSGDGRYEDAALLGPERPQEAVAVAAPPCWAGYAGRHRNKLIGF